MNRFLVLSLSLIILCSAKIIDIQEIPQDFTFTYALTNPYDFPIKVLKYGTPFAFCAPKNCKMTLNNESLSHEGNLGYPDKRFEHAFLVLHAHETKSVNLTLSRYFSLTSAGNYSFWIEGSYYKFWNPLTETVTAPDLIPAKLSSFEEFEVSDQEFLKNATEESYNYTEIPIKFPSQTNVLTFSKDLTTVNESPKDELIESPNDLDEYKEHIRKKLKNITSDRLDKALKKIPDLNSPNYKRWFDNKADPAYHKLVVGYIQKMKERLDEVKIEFAPMPEENCTLVHQLAYVKKKEWDTIYLCPAFFAEDIPLMGVEKDVTYNVMDGQVSVLLHELVHATLKIEVPPDPYHPEECLELAKNKPYEAIMAAENYALYINSLGYRVEIVSIYGYGLQTAGRNKDIFSKDSSNLEFECQGEYPQCVLKSLRYGSYLDYYNPWIGDPTLELTQDQKSWTFDYQGNGASMILIPKSKTRVRLDSNSRLIQGTIKDEDYTTLWLIRLDGVNPNTRVIEMRDDDRGTWFNAKEGMKSDSPLICDQTKIKNLQLILMGSSKRTIFKALSNPLFLNRRVITNLVKLSSDPYFWSFKTDSNGKYSISCYEKPGFAKVYCSNSFSNAGSVYTDGIFQKTFTFKDVALGEI